MFDIKLPCGHSYIDHAMMEEAIASCAIEGIKTDKSACEMLIAEYGDPLTPRTRGNTKSNKPTKNK